MAEAKRDQNRVTTILGVENDGVIRFALIDGVTNGLRVHVIGGGGPTFSSIPEAERDQNRVTSLLAETTLLATQAGFVDGNRALYVARA